jgi:hypothetical protein
MSIPILTPKVICNSASLNRFLDGKREHQEIVSLMHRKGYGDESLVYGPLKATKILLSSPVRLIQMIVLKVMAFLANGVGAEAWAKKWTLSSKHQMRPLIQLSYQMLYGKDLIAPSRNIQKAHLDPFYVQPSLPHSLVSKHAHLRSLGTNNREREIFFFQRGGVCQGMTHKFLSHYLRIRSKESGSLASVRAVTRLFKKGADQQASFLQNFYHSPTLTLHAKKKNQSSSAAIRDLPKGAYAISIQRSATEGHRVAYIKESQKLGYLYDPIIGTLRFQGEEQAEKVTDYLLGSWLSKRSIETIDLVTLKHK